MSCWTLETCTCHHCVKVVHSCSSFSRVGKEFHLSPILAWPLSAAALNKRHRFHYSKTGRISSPNTQNGTSHCFSTCLLVTFHWTCVPTGHHCLVQFSLYPLSLIHGLRVVTACHSPTSHLQGNPIPNQNKPNNPKVKVQFFCARYKHKLLPYGNIFWNKIFFFELRTSRIFRSLMVHRMERQHRERQCRQIVKQPTRSATS